MVHFFDLPRGFLGYNHKMAGNQPCMFHGYNRLFLSWVIVIPRIADEAIVGPKRSDAERGEVAATASLGALSFESLLGLRFFLKFGVLDGRTWKIRIEEHLWCVDMCFKF